MIIKSSFLVPNGFDGMTLWPFIFILPECANDVGLLAHEQVHYQRMAWWSPVWWLLYLLFPPFRVREEVLAYKVSIQHGMPLGKAAWWLCRYDSRMTLTKALDLLK